MRNDSLAPLLGLPWVSTVLYGVSGAIGIRVLWRIFREKLVALSAESSLHLTVPNGHGAAVCGKCVANDKPENGCRYRWVRQQIESRHR